MKSRGRVSTPDPMKMTNSDLFSEALAKEETPKPERMPKPE
jgi:hypothetical protein